MADRRLDVLLIEGSKVDRCRTENAASLIDRVWMLSRPPLFVAKPTVSARRQEVMRQTLMGTFIKCDTQDPTKKHDAR